MKFYQGPVCIVEDILHLEIAMGSIDTSFFLKKNVQEKAYRLFEEVQFHGYLAKNPTGELTILWFLAKWKVKKAETYKLF